jgi:hypothetical protein
MQDMALYFTEFRLDGSRQDSYSLLLEQICATNRLSVTLFSTLNYECLLELATSGLAIPLTYNEPELSPTTATIWKLHGSCNFQPSGVDANRGVSYGFGVSFGGPVLRKQLTEIREWLQGDTALYPAMCLFLANKPSQMAPETFAEYWNHWSAFVRNAETVTIIGARPHPPDTHIWGPLAATPARLYFVGSEAAFNDWLPARSGGESEFVSRLFEPAIDQIVGLMNAAD